MKEGSDVPYAKVPRLNMDGVSNSQLIPVITACLVQIDCPADGVGFNSDGLKVMPMIHHDMFER